MDAIDLFAGAGGWTTGAAAAGVRVVAAVNHWDLAVRSHKANHPSVQHRCEDVSVVDPLSLPSHGIVIASPACTGHAKARGKERPTHDAARMTAFGVVHVVEQTRPDLLLVENVTEFMGWVLFKPWREALELLGYKLTFSVVDAADFGVPQHRVRLLISGSLKHQLPQIVPPAAVDKRPVRSVVHFDRGAWSPVEGHCDATLRRVARGRAEFGRRFVMPYYGSGSGETGRSLDRPLGTVTTRDRWALVDGERMRMLMVEEYKGAMTFPPEYVLCGNRAEQIHQLGNAVPPLLAEHAIRQVLAAA